MAWDPDNAIPKGYIKKELKVPGGKVITYRNPNPDPVEQEKGLNDVMDILMIGYRRRLLQEQRQR